MSTYLTSPSGGLPGRVPSPWRSSRLIVLLAAACVVCAGLTAQAWHPAASNRDRRLGVRDGGVVGSNDRLREVGPVLQRSFVWLASVPTGRQAYVVFRRRFELSAVPLSATLHLFADSRYQLWVNGQYVERGPCRFDPIAPEYDTLDVQPFLRAGANAIAVLVHHYHDGKDSTDWVSINGRIMRHAPGLTAQLVIRDQRGRVTRLQTDESWRGTVEARYQPSPTDRWENTWSSLPDRIEARSDIGEWTQAVFDDSRWARPVFVDGGAWGPLRPRGIPRLRETEIVPLTLVQRSYAEGSAVRAAKVDDTTRSLSEALPLALNAGDQLVVDAGQFAQAYSVLELEADSGSELELEYAQRFFETERKPSGSYGHANRYSCRAGRQTYMSGDTFGFKYLVVRLRSGQAVLHSVRLINRLYPFEVAGRFQCDDAVLTRLWSHCIRTIRVCSEDAYVDCATRERVEWMADGYAVAYRATRVALAGPGPDGRPVYGDARLLRNLLRHIGQSLQPDGRLKAHHPSDRWDIHGYIEDYACLWVQALREYVDHTEDLALARELWPALTAQVRWFLERRTGSGLLNAREFVYPGSNPLCYKVCEGTTLNAYLARALRDAAHLAGRLGCAKQRREYARAAEEIAAAVNRWLWDSTAGTYSGGIVDGKVHPPTVPAAFLALHFGVVPSSRKPQVQAWLLNHAREQGGLPFAYQFLLEELYAMDQPGADRLALDIIREKWAAMSRSETGTVWEGFDPGEDCHEAGAVPAYFLSAYVLGVRLDGPAAKRRLRIEPRLADLSEAEGTVATEVGLVPVRWRRDQVAGALDFLVEIPVRTRATLTLPAGAQAPSLILDGRKLSQRQIRRSGRHFCVELSPGRHSGSLTDFVSRAADR